MVFTCWVCCFNGYEALERAIHCDWWPATVDRSVRSQTASSISCVCKERKEGRLILCIYLTYCLAAHGVQVRRQSSRHTEHWCVGKRWLGLQPVLCAAGSVRWVNVTFFTLLFTYFTRVHTTHTLTLASRILNRQDVSNCSAYHQLALRLGINIRIGYVYINMHSLPPTVLSYWVLLNFTCNSN